MRNALHGLQAWLQRQPYFANSCLAAVIMGSGDAAAQRIEWWKASRRSETAAQQTAGGVGGLKKAAGLPEGSSMVDHFGILPEGSAEETQIMFRYDYIRGVTMASWAGVGFSPICVWVYQKIFSWFAAYPASQLRWNFARAVCANTMIATPLNFCFFIYATAVERWLRELLPVAGGEEAPAEGQSFGGEVTATVAGTTGCNVSGEKFSLQREIEQKIRERLLPTVQKSMTFWIPISALNFQYTHADFRVVVVSIAGFLWNTALSLIQHE